MLQITLLYALYGIVFIFVKQALLFSKPVFLTGARMVTAGICSFVLYKFWAKPVRWSTVTGYHAWYIFLLGVFNVYLTNANEAWSLQYLSAGKVAFIYNLSPFFSLFFSRYMFKEKITFLKILGMVIACISITPLLIDNTAADIADHTFKIGFISIAEIVMIVASAATAYGWVLMKYLMDERPDFSSYFLNSVSLIIGGVLCFVQAYFIESAPFVIPGYAGQFFGYMMIMMFLQNLVAYNFNAYLLKAYSATFVILFSFIMPVITEILGYVMLGEVMTTEFFICSFGVAIGLFIFYRQELAEEQAKGHI